MNTNHCQALTRAGAPCQATPQAGGVFCYWHDPDNAEAVREAARKGGVNKSNRARAAKELADVMELDGVQAVLSRALRKVEDGQMPPGPANALANVARALVSVKQADELEERIAELERRAMLR